MPIILLLIAAVVVAVILTIYKKQKINLKDEINKSGEDILIEPSVVLYQGGNSFVSSKTFGVIALTNRRVIFRKPLGADIEQPISHIAKVSETEWFRGNRRAGKKFLVLENNSGREIGFIVDNPVHWIREISARLSGNET